MKKKTILSSSVFVASLLTASAVFAGGPEVVVIPDYFTGFYIGGTVSLNHASLDEDSSLVNTVNQTFGLPNDTVGTPTFTLLLPAGTISSVEADGGSWDVFGGVVGGAGKVWNHRWYLGALGFGQWGEQSDTASRTTNNAFIISGFDTTADPSTFTTSGTITSSTQTKVQNYYGAAAKLGWLPNPRTMFFAKIGAAWAKIKVNTSVSGSNFASLSDFDAGVLTDLTTVSTSISGSASDNDTKVSIYAGLGAEQIVYGDNLSISVEWDYMNFGTVNTGSFALNTTSTTNIFDDTGTLTSTATVSGPGAVEGSGSGSARVSSLYAALNYYFNPGWF